MNDSLKIIYIAGYGRSGSTLLDIMLGNIKGVSSAGEIVNLAGRAEVVSCSCGKFCSACEVWGKVITSLRKQFFSLDELQKLQRQTESWNALPSWLALPERNKKYLELQSALFGMTKSVFGCDWLVDSSKTAYESMWRPLVLNQNGGIELRVIHLIRSPDEVMASCKKGRNRDLVEGKVAQRRWLSAERGLIGWVVANLAAMRVRKKLGKDHCLVVDYSSLVKNPVLELERISKWLGLDATEVIDRVRYGKDLPVGHLVAGNRMARTATVTIGGAFESKSGLTHFEFVLAAFFGKPLMKWFLGP